MIQENNSEKFSKLISQIPAINQFFPQKESNKIKSWFECYYFKIEFEGTNYYVYTAFDDVNRFITTGFHEVHPNSHYDLTDKFFAPNFVRIDGANHLIEIPNWVMTDKKNSCDFFMSLRRLFYETSKSSPQIKFLDIADLKGIELTDLSIYVYREFLEYHNYKPGEDNKCTEETWERFKIIYKDSEVRSPYIEINLPPDILVTSFSESYYAPLGTNRKVIESKILNVDASNQIRQLLTSYF